MGLRSKWAYGTRGQCPNQRNHLVPRSPVVINHLTSDSNEIPQVDNQTRKNCYPLSSFFAARNVTQRSHNLMSIRTSQWSNAAVKRFPSLAAALAGWLGIPFAS